MNTAKAWMIGILLVFFLGCRSTVVTGGFVASHEYKGFTESTADRVRGESCKVQIFFFPVGKMDLNEAFANAMAKAPPGTTGLANMNIGYTYPAVIGGAMFGPWCFFVEGRPATRKGSIASAQN
jgi:hypothetical protein